MESYQIDLESMNSLEGFESIDRDGSGNITVKETERKRELKKEVKPYGSEPIRGKKVKDKFKSDLNEVDNTQTWEKLLLEEKLQDTLKSQNITKKNLKS